MKDFYDLQQLLKSFDIIIYMKNRYQLLQLVEFEVRELHRVKLIEQEQFLRAIAIIKKERRLMA